MRGTGMTTPSTLHELHRRSAEIDTAIADLDQQFAQLAGAFDLGDKHALQQADGIEQRIGQLRREKAIIAGREQRLNQDQLDQAAQAEQAEHNRQLQQAREIADALCASHVDLDRLMNTLREQFERRASLLGQLQRSDVVDSALVNRLSTRAVATRALCAAGLAKHFDVQTCAPGSMVPLTRANAILLGIGRPAAAATATNGNANDDQAAAGAIPRRPLAHSNGGDRS
jgi:hypothetical protein